ERRIGGLELAAVLFDQRFRLFRALGADALECLVRIFPEQQINCHDTTPVCGGTWRPDYRPAYPVASPLRHRRLYAGHPRLIQLHRTKTWMPATSAGHDVGRK